MESTELGFEFHALGTACRIRLAGCREAEAQAAAHAAIDEVRRIETKYSRHRHDSAMPTAEFTAKPRSHPSSSHHGHAHHNAPDSHFAHRRAGRVRGKFARRRSGVAGSVGDGDIDIRGVVACCTVACCILSSGAVTHQ